MNAMLRALFVCTLVAAPALGCGGCTEGGGDQPPTVVLTGTPVGGTFLVGEELNISVQASDPEGGAVTFSWDHKPKELNWSVTQRAKFLPFSNEALFTWDPIASDALHDEPIQLIFIVTDVAGSVTEKVVPINILPGNGRPTFKSSASELYDPRSGGPLQFDVVVVDQDSEEVTLGMDQATRPAGSDFEQTGPYQGRFTWQPTAEQLERRVYSADFTADDGENPVERFKVTIVIRSATPVVIDTDQTEQMCPGEAVVQHTPLGPQRSPATPYRFEARLLDPAYDRAVLYITSSPPYTGESNPDEREGDAIEMTDDGNGTLVAEVAPYTAFIGDTGVLTVFYQICAFDDDASGLDAIACAPSSGDLELWHAFNVYTPDADECVDDSLDATSGNDDFDTATPVTERWDTYRVCSGNDDYFSVTLRDGESALFSSVYNDGAPITFQAFDDARTPVEVKRSDCTGLATAEVTAPPGGGTFYFKVAGNNVPYAMRTFKSGNAAECSDASIEPNDTAATATPVTAGATQSAEICPDGNDLDVFAIDLQAGETLTVTHTFSNANGNLDMTLFGPGQEVDKGGTGTGAFTFGLTDEETLQHTATASGTYNLLVFNNNEGTNSYQLRFEVTSAPPCTDNDQAGRDRASAMIIPAMDEVTLSPFAVCPGAADWFQRTEFEGVLVLGELNVTGGEGTIDDVTVTVYDANNNVVGSGVRESSWIEFDVFPAASAQHYYKVETTARVEYELLLLR